MNESKNEDVEDRAAEYVEVIKRIESDNNDHGGIRVHTQAKNRVSDTGTEIKRRSTWK